MADPHPALDALLRPSLTSEHRHVPLYSTRAQFFVAFFGGPLSFLAFAWLNTRLLERTRRDAWLFVLAALVSLAGVVAIGWLGGVESAPAWVEALGSRRQLVRYGARALGIIVFGVFYFYYRAVLNTAEMLSDKPRSAWRAGLVCVLVGGGVQVALGVAVARFFGAPS